MQQIKRPQRSFLIFFISGLLIVIFMNALLPNLSRSQQVPYSQFLEMLAQQQIVEVEQNVQGDQISFLAKNNQGNTHSYTTGILTETNLTSLLTQYKGADDKDIVFSRETMIQNNSLVVFLFSWLLPIAIFFGFGFFLMRMMQKKSGGTIMSFGKSNAKIYIQSQTDKTFADVAGQDEAKEALIEIVDFLHNPDKYRRIGAVMPKGALLVGPPGTGKTLLAKAVAGEANVPFFSIAGSEFVEMFVGMGAARVRELFKQAGEKAPCIVFIDEIDTIGKSRDGGVKVGGGNDEREQTLNQLLTEMDGFDGSKGVIILAATNRPDSLDKALLRPGRFDRRIPVELPDLAGREAILKVHAKKIMLEENVNLTAIARSTSGTSGAELANIINEAALRAVKYNRSIVNQTDLEEAVEVIVAGYQRKGKVISPKEKRIIAYHEIGHALVAAKQSHSDPVTKISIIPRTSGALGYTIQTPEKDSKLLSKEEILDKISISTGGRAAEELVFGTFTSGASNDIEQATRLARSMVTRLGMSKEFDMMALETLSNQYLGRDSTLICSPETAAQIDQEVLSIIQSCHQKALNILLKNQDTMHRLAAFLLEKETITSEEFKNLLNSPA